MEIAPLTPVRSVSTNLEMIAVKIGVVLPNVVEDPWVKGLR